MSVIMIIWPTPVSHAFTYSAVNNFVTDKWTDSYCAVCGNDALVKKKNEIIFFILLW